MNDDRRRWLAPALMAGLLATSPACGDSGGGDGDDGGGAGDGGAPTGAARLSLGSHGSCARFEGGELWCWGWNQNGQLGTERRAQFERPTKIEELGAVHRMALAGDFGCAALGDGGGAIQCMGYDHGGTNTMQMVSSNVEQIGAGYGHACALLDDGTIECWGANRYGQLGDGTTMGRTTPVPVQGLSGARDLAVGADRTCAVDGSGGVSCWGTTPGSVETRTEPQTISGLGAVTALDAAGNQTCAVVEDGRVQCWGPGACSAAGSDSCDDREPLDVPGLSDVRQIATGSSSACALDSGGRVWCWGQNGSGQLGDGTREARSEPEVVEGLPEVDDLAMGDSHVCAHGEGDVYCWGSNGNGRIGNGTTVDQLTPVNVL